MDNESLKATKKFLKALKNAEKSGMDFEFCLSFFEDILDTDKINRMNNEVGEKERLFEEAIEFANREWDV